MRTTFYINEKRLTELKSFIKEELPTARFLQNPYKQGNEIGISLELSVDDNNKLDTVRNEWYLEELPTSNYKNSFWKRLYQKIFR